MKKGIICVLIAVSLMTGCGRRVNHIEQGTQQLESQQYTDAVASFSQSLEEKEDVPEAYRGLGMAYFEQQDYEAARDAFQKVIENEGEADAILYSFIGACSMQLDDIKGALDAFEKGIALAAEADGKKKEDEPDYSRAVQEMKFNQIVCYEKELDWETARDKAEAYVKEYPDDQAAQKEVEFLKTR